MKKIILIIIGMLLIGGLIYFKMENIKTNKLETDNLNGLISASSFNESDLREVGYEFLNSSGSIVNEANADIIHVWNTQDDYYINRTSAIQLTNHFQDYWSENKLCLYITQFGTMTCSDVLGDWSNSWIINTDNSTYVNLTGTRTYGTGNGPNRVEVNLTLEYYLDLNSNTIRITPYLKSTGGANSHISGYGIWRVQDIQINMSQINNTLIINDSSYLLNQSLNLTFNNLSDLHWEVNDSLDNSLDFYWNDTNYLNGVPFTNNYEVRVQNETNQYNAPIEYWTNISTLNQGDTFSSVFRWHDAAPANYVFDYLSCSADTSTSITVGGNVQFTCTAYQCYGGSCGTDVGAQTGNFYGQNSTDDSTFSNSPTSGDIYINAVPFASQSLSNIKVETSHVLSQATTTFNSEGTYYIRAYINDASTNNNPLVSSSITVTVTGDSTPPTYSLNQSNNTLIGQPTLFSLYVNDDTALETGGQYIFSTNNSGVWTNESAVNFTATPSWANVTKTLNDTAGISIGYRWYLTDNAGNPNNTGIFSLNTTSPGATNPSIQFLQPPTLPNASTTSNTSVIANVSINESNLDEFKWNWNGTNYTIMDNSLVASWNFNNISAIGENDTLVVDVSGNGNNGIVQGGNHTTNGVFGSAMQFDGSDDYVYVPGDTSLQVSSDFTISAWVKLHATPGGSTPIVIYRDTTAGHHNYYLDVNTARRVFMGFYTGSTWIDSGNYGIVLNTEQWYYVTGVFDDTANTITIYIDGALSRQSSTTYSPYPTDADFLDIGAEDSNIYLKSDIDEVRIYNRTLSVAEINESYMSSLSKYDTDKWSFYINQTKNANAVLDYGTYTYQAFAKDVVGNENQTEERTVCIGSCAGGEPPPSNCWIETPGKIVIPPSCKYYTNVKEVIFPS